MAVSYSTVAFDMDSAVNGALVGVDTQDPNDLTMYCGTLKIIKDSPIDAPTYEKDGRTVKAIHQATIKGSTIWCTDAGVVLSCVPALPQIGGANVIAVGTQLMVLKAIITITSGTSQTRTRAPEEGHTRDIKISDLEPRDQFALQALSIIMAKIDHPEAADDANIIQACYTSYRWANAMMLAAADSRRELDDQVAPTPSEDTPKDEVDVNTDALTTNVERLLYNINAALHNKNVNDKKLLDEGFPVKNIQESNTVVPFVAKLDANSEIKEVKKVTDVPGLTSINTTLGTTNTRLSSISNELGCIETDMENINTSVRNIPKVPYVDHTITIKYSIFQTKYLRFEFNSDMAYSDVSVFLELSVSEESTTATRKVGFMLPKGSVVVVEELDAEVTAISSITSATVRGKGVNDSNTYSLTQS